MCTYFRGMHWHYLSLNRQCPFLSWWNLSTFSRHWRGPGTFPVAQAWLSISACPRALRDLAALISTGNVKERIGEILLCHTLSRRVYHKRYNGRTGLTCIVLDSPQTCGMLRIWIWQVDRWGSGVSVALFDTKIHEIVCVLGPLITISIAIHSIGTFYTAGCASISDVSSFLQVVQPGECVIVSNDVPLATS